MNIHNFWILFLTFWIVGPTQVYAQSVKPVGEGQIAFEISPRELLQSDFAVETDLENRLIRLDGHNEWGWLADIVVARGMIDLPVNVQAMLERMENGKMPFHFYFQFQFESEDIYREVCRQALENSIPLQRNGRTFYRVDEMGTDFHLRFANKNEPSKTFIMATSKYIFDDASLSKVTAMVQQTWNDQERQPLRLVADMAAADVFFDSSSSMLKQAVPKVLSPYAETLAELRTLQLEVTLSGEDAVKLSIVADDNDKASVIADRFRGLKPLLESITAKRPSTEETPALDFMKGLVNIARLSHADDQVVLTLGPPKDVADQTKAILDSAYVRRWGRWGNDPELARVAKAVSRYRSEYKQLPFSNNQNGKYSDQLSWKVRLLPFLSEHRLHTRFEISEAWDSPRNLALANSPTAVLKNKGLSDIYWVKSDVMTYRDVARPTSKTICLIKGPHVQNWAKPSDWTAEEVIAYFDRLPAGDEVVVGFYSGSTGRLPATIDRTELRKMLDPTGDPE